MPAFSFFGALVQNLGPVSWPQVRVPVLPNNAMGPEPPGSSCQRIPLEALVGHSLSKLFEGRHLPAIFGSP